MTRVRQIRKNGKADESVLDRSGSRDPRRTRRGREVNERRRSYELPAPPRTAYARHATDGDQPPVRGGAPRVVAHIARNHPEIVCTQHTVPSCLLLQSGRRPRRDLAKGARLQGLSVTGLNRIDQRSTI